MQIISQNLLRTATLKREQKHWRNFLLTLYLAIIFLTFTTIGYLYYTNTYIIRLYSREIGKLQSKIENFQPKITYISKLYNERKNMKEQIIKYQMRRHRPEFWLSKLIVLAEKLPPQIIIQNIFINTTTRPGEEVLTVKGILPLKENNTDLSQIYEYKSNLEKDTRFMLGFSKIELLQNRIFTTSNQQTVSFTLGIYE